MSTAVSHHGNASSFADPADVVAFYRCKKEGKSDEECFKVGDNAVGYWGDDTAQDSGPSCALPPEDIIERWGSLAGGKHKLVSVTVGAETATVTLKDLMPHRKFVKHGVVIDLNPDACFALELVPPVLTQAHWSWIDGEKGELTV